MKIFIKLVSALFCLSCLSIAYADNETSPEVGPFYLVAQHSSVFGSTLGFHWNNFIAPHTAFGFELDYGSNEFRLGGTLGHAFSPNHRFKITAEHFGQDFEYKFLPNTALLQFKGQNAFGAAYQYLLIQNTWLKSLNLSGYFTQAQSQSFADQIIVLAPNNQILVQQYYAGADSENAEASVMLQPFAWTRFGIGLDYDNVSYSTRYVPANNSSGVGATFTLNQLITDHFKVNLLARPRHPYQQYAAGVSWLFNTRPGTRLELDLAGSHLTGDIFPGTDNQVLLALAYSWGGDSNAPRANYATENPDSLINWTSQPAVYMPAVLVQKDILTTP